MSHKIDFSATYKLSKWHRSVAGRYL